MDEFWILNQSIQSLLTGRMGLSTKVGASDEGTKSSPTCSQSNSRSNSLAVHKLKNSVGGGGASPRKSIAASFQTKFSREGNLKITFSEKLIFQNSSKLKLTFFVGTKVGPSQSMVHEISNGICKFSPTSTKGKWIFLVQTVILSFSPILLLCIQNSVNFSDMIQWKNEILLKVKSTLDGVFKTKIEIW